MEQGVDPVMRGYRAKIMLIAAAVALISGPARADDAPPSDDSPAPAYRNGVVTVISENDLYAVHNRDRHYTDGIQFGWMSSDDDVPAWARAFGDGVPLLDPEAHRRIGFILAQAMFTPENKMARTPILDDRPYAAWLYGGLKLQSESDSRLDTFEIDLGVVGPAALGEQVQNHWHSVIGAGQAEGWSNQIKNEPGLDLMGERLWRISLTEPENALGVDVIPNVVGSLGNIYTYAGGGGMIRLGRELQSDFGPARIDPALPGSDSFHAPERFGWYVFAGVEGRAVARNIFLDGNTFATSQSVSKKPFVGDLQGGFALLYGRTRLTYTQVARSKEFDGQRGADYLGSIALSIAF